MRGIAAKRRTTGVGVLVAAWWLVLGGGLGVGPAFAASSQPTFTAVSAGGLHTCAIRTDGGVACWGKNNSGQSVPPVGVFRAVSAGGFHTCGIRTDDTVACWGDNLSGQSSAPSGTFKAISAGYAHTCAIRTDGTVACWGGNLFGQSSPPSGTFKAVSAGVEHTCGIRTDDAVDCWGYNRDGRSSAPSGTFKAVSADRAHTCGIRSDATVACWGSNAYGQASPPSGTFKAISAAGVHTCGIRTDNTLACWGNNANGQASPPPGTFKALSAGPSHTCAIRTDDTVACWGDNSDGQSSPPSAAATPYLDFVAATLHASSPGTEGKIWWVSRDSVLPPGWLLQTPDCWGVLRCSEPPAGGAKFLERMAYLISTARESVDVAELYQLSLTDGGPEGGFFAAIVRGLRLGHERHPKQEPVVRVLIGKFPAGFYSADAFARSLALSVGPWLKVQSASQRTGLTSWNHAKVIDVDGRAAIVGGMNYWNSDYLQTANPVNDLSMEVEGQAATDISRYDDVLWAWTCEHRSGFHTDVTLVNLRNCVKVAKTQATRPIGTASIMVLGHLGNGISVPGEPYGRESAPFARPPLHGNKCTGIQADYSETNDSRAYEYRNPGEPAVRALIERAQRSIFISQQDLLSCLPKPLIATEAKFDERLIAILASKIMAGVPIKIVLSAGGGGAAGYGNGFTLKDLAKILHQALEVDSHVPAAQARAKLCDDVGLAALRNGPGATWANGMPFANHAKLVAVDDEAFYIGSQNLYPGRLQELGVIVDNKAAADELNFTYLRPMWEWSKRDALINPATKKCDL